MEWEKKFFGYSKYEYLSQHPLIIRSLSLLGIFTWSLSFFGFLNFFRTNSAYFIIFLPILIIISIDLYLSYSINLFYKRLDITKHNSFRDNFWLNLWNKFKNTPSVDIFLTICGEDISILEKTWKSVSNIGYANKKVYVLDDKGDEEARILANKFGFIYLSRPNKGEMKKSGNLKYGFDNSNGDYIVIFDADFVPNKDFIIELLPYMSDEKVGIVQSPQSFTSEDKLEYPNLEYGAAYVQEDFYRVIQTSRDHFNAAICVGSNAIYRRKALEQIGGPVLIEHSEDIYTGLKLTDAGFKIKYVPLILAKGLCPNDIESYFKQQNRWGSGTLTLLFSGTILKSKLSIAQKICYLSGSFYYITHILSIALSFMAIMILYTNTESIGVNISLLPFIPYFIFSFLLLPLLRNSKLKPGIYLAYIIFSYGYVYAFFSSLRNKSLTWTPTNLKKSPVSKEFKQTVYFATTYTLIYTLLLIGLIYKYPIVLNLKYISLTFWIYFILFLNYCFLFLSYKKLFKGINPFVNFNYQTFIKRFNFVN